MASDSQIDLLKFQQSSGNVAWLPLVAAAFLRQLPQWRREFDAAVAAHDGTVQAELLHKIKGACYAVAAYGAAEVLSQAEALQARNEAQVASVVLARLALVESELQAIIARASPAGQTHGL